MSSSIPRILFATGGSGGHLYPALAIAESLQERWPGASTLFVTTGRPVEQQICSRAGVEHHALPLLAVAVARRRPLKFLAATARSFHQARALIRSWNPNLIIGTGGWSMTPVVQAARRLRTPVILCEQNIIPGRAMRWLARRASTLCISFPQTEGHLRTARHIVVTGNPVRRAIRSESAEESSFPRHLLILGGSQGAQALNGALRHLAPRLAGSLQGWRVTHQTGSRAMTAELQADYEHAGITAEVAPFFDDLPSRCRNASLAISRAGATTLAELACLGVPTLLVPYPLAAADHQQRNAEVYARAGAAQIVPQASDDHETAGRLSAPLVELLANPGRLASMSQAMRTLARPQAAERVVDEIATLLNR